MNYTLSYYIQTEAVHYLLVIGRHKFFRRVSNVRERKVVHLKGTGAVSWVSNPLFGEFLRAIHGTPTHLQLENAIPPTAYIASNSQ